MAIWTFQTDSNFTSFYFPEENDLVSFRKMTNLFIESKPAATEWQTLYMLRAEPKKHPDFYSIEDTDVIAINQKGVDHLARFFTSDVELLPIETDAGKYYAINILKFVDCLNKTESDYTATNDGKIVQFTLLDFDEEKLEENHLFKIPQLPYQPFVTDEFQEEYEKVGLRGLLFDPDINLIFYQE